MYIIINGWWFYPNPLNKFTVSMRDKPKFNADGSRPLYLQNEYPGKAKLSRQLVAGGEGRVHRHDAHVLAEGERALDPAARQRHLAAGAAGAGEVT